MFVVKLETSHDRNKDKYNMDASIIGVIPATKTSIEMTTTTTTVKTTNNEKNIGTSNVMNNDMNNNQKTNLCANMIAYCAAKTTSFELI